MYVTLLLFIAGSAIQLADLVVVVVVCCNVYRSIQIGFALFFRSVVYLLVFCDDEASFI